MIRRGGRHRRTHRSPLAAAIGGYARRMVRRDTGTGRAYLRSSLTRWVLVIGVAGAVLLALYSRDLQWQRNLPDTCKQHIALCPLAR